MMMEHIKLALITGVAFLATLCSGAEMRHVSRDRGACGACVEASK